MEKRTTLTELEVRRMEIQANDTADIVRTVAESRGLPENLVASAEINAVVNVVSKNVTR